MVQTCPCSSDHSCLSEDVSTKGAVKSSVSFRPADWPERLATVIKDWQKRRFIWGKHDCVHFAADGLTAVSGRNWCALDLGTYRTRRQARAQLAQLGFTDLPSAVTALLGSPQAGPPQRGDLVTIETPYGPALGLCLGAHLAAIGPEGLSFLPLSATSLSWRV